ncbi:MAG: aldehyde ferredoxin oxidoreductase C-terminal domain-containing protein, partial [Candidatus Bathyarchaeia archaeon]
RGIVDQPNEFYQALARGVDYASNVYGGSEFALAFGGNEMPGYHTGAATHIGALTGSRHSHLDSAGYSLDQKSKAPQSPRDMMDQLVKEEGWRQILSSLVVCFFARGMYEPDLTVKALTALGYQVDVKELKSLGEEIYAEKQRLKLSEGFDARKLRIPRRILETPTPHGQIQEAHIRAALQRYEEILGGVTKN